MKNVTTFNLRYSCISILVFHIGIFALNLFLFITGQLFESYSQNVAVRSAINKSLKINNKKMYFILYSIYDNESLSDPIYRQYTIYTTYTYIALDWGKPSKAQAEQKTPQDYISLQGI